MISRDMSYRGPNGRVALRKANVKDENTSAGVKWARPSPSRTQWRKSVAPQPAVGKNIRRFHYLMAHVKFLYCVLSSITLNLDVGNHIKAACTVGRKTSF